MKHIEFRPTAKDLTPSSRARSFTFAFNGFRILCREPNMLLHIAATAGVIIAGCIAHLSAPKWIAIVFAIAVVLITEALNTAIEKLADFACDNKWSPRIKIIKDIAAAAVLLASLAAVATGIIVFFFWK